jgi:hypothetical protein
MGTHPINLFRVKTALLTKNRVRKCPIYSIYNWGRIFILDASLVSGFSVERCYLLQENYQLWSPTGKARSF